MVTEKPQEFLCQSLSKTTQEYNSGVSCECVKQLCKDFLFGDLKGPNHICGKTLESDAVLDDAGQRTHSCLGYYSGWIVQTSKMQFVNCPCTSELRPLVMIAMSNFGRGIGLEIVCATRSWVAS